MGDRTALEKVRNRIEEIHARQVARRSSERVVAELVSHEVSETPGQWPIVKASREELLNIYEPRAYYLRCRAAGFATSVDRGQIEREEARLRRVGR